MSSYGIANAQVASAMQPVAQAVLLLEHFANTASTGDRE
jgi:hypothetical protein